MCRLYHTTTPSARIAASTAAETHQTVPSRRVTGRNPSARNAAARSSSDFRCKTVIEHSFRPLMKRTSRSTRPGKALRVSLPAHSRTGRSRTFLIKLCGNTADLLRFIRRRKSAGVFDIARLDDWLASYSVDVLSSVCKPFSKLAGDLHRPARDVYSGVLHSLKSGAPRIGSRHGDLRTSLSAIPPDSPVSHPSLRSDKHILSLVPETVKDKASSSISMPVLDTAAPG